MTPAPLRRLFLTALAAGSLVAVSVYGQQDAPQRPGPVNDGFRFKSGIELINVTTTVVDASGRFVAGLHQEDFTVYEDDQPVDLTQFSADRAPVSLGIALDTSGSMAGQKIQSAQSALDRFLYDLLDKGDDIFLYRFSNTPVLLQGWTTDRSLISRALGRLSPSGGTAMYDAVSEALPLADSGQHKKKALLIISDGNDTSSRITMRDLKQQIRQSEMLIYAVGIDGDFQPTEHQRPPQAQPPRWPTPFPVAPPRVPGRFPVGLSQGGNPAGWRRNDDRVNISALRDMTDDSGGRTEIVRDPRDLNPATASIADELSKQYTLAYVSPIKRDGRWHTIRVEVRNSSYRVRARRGYVAS